MCWEREEGFGGNEGGSATAEIAGTLDDSGLLSVCMSDVTQILDAVAKGNQQAAN